MIGQRIPDITFKTRVKDEEGNYDWKDVTTCDYFNGKSVILFPNSDFIFAFSIKFFPLSNGSFFTDNSLKDTISIECFLNKFLISFIL